MKNLTLNKTMLSGFVVIVAALTLLIFLSWSKLDQLAQMRRVEADVTTAVGALKDVRFHIVQIQQFHTDVSATGDTGGVEEAAEHLTLGDSALQRLDRAFPESRDFGTRMRSQMAALHTAGIEMARVYIEEGRAAGNLLMQNPDGGFDAVASALTEEIDRFQARLDAALGDAVTTADALQNSARNVLIGAGSVCALLVATILIVVYRKVIPPIARLRATVEQIERNSDLTARIDMRSHDEIGATAQAVDNMLERFKRIIEQVTGSTSQLATAAEQMSAITEQASQGVTEQQHETDQVATAINEMTATVQEVARSAEQAAHSAQEADRETRSGRQVVKDTIGAIGSLAREVERAAQVIHQLEEDSGSIGMVLDVIKGIAEQTNLLALNAAIEAARAGEQGRGFAVVADEVRTLASRTQQSTLEIQQMIERLQSGAKEAVKVMEHGRSQAQASVEQAERAGKSLDAIASSVANINDMNTQIASAAEEQSAVADEINRNIVAISQVSAQTADGTRQTATASDELARLAVELQQMVAKFRV